MALDPREQAKKLGSSLGLIDAARAKAAEVGAGAIQTTGRAALQAAQIADQAKRSALGTVANVGVGVYEGYTGKPIPVPAAVARAEPASRLNVGKIRPADKVSEIKPMPKRADYGLPPERKTPAPAYDRTGNSDPAVIAELAANKRRQDAQATAVPKQNYENITRQVSQGITRGYDTAIRAPAAAPAAEEFNPSAELYARAQRLLSAGQDEGDGGFNARIRAAIARKQGARLMDTARQFYGEQGATARAQAQESGALTRAQMQENAARERLDVSEAGAMERARMQNAGEIARTRLAGQNTIANTALQQQLARDAAIEKMVAQESMPSTQAKTMYDRVLAGKASAEEQALVQKAIATQTYIQSEEGTPERGKAGRELAMLQGRVDPAVQAQLATARATVGNIAATPEQQAIAQAILDRYQTQGYADGGAVASGLDRSMQTPMAAPTMGMPNIQPQVQIVSDYRAYAAAAARLGATPVAFDQFASMKASQSAMPPAGFADGGLVEEPSTLGFAKYLMRGGKLDGEQSAVTRTKSASANPALDTVADAAGVIPAVGSAISALRARQQALDAATNFADGGAVRVGGKQVIGAGTGKSDSIPAIIDGETPAALSTGEFVFPVEAVRHFGMDKLNKMVEAARNSSSN